MTISASASDTDSAYDSIECSVVMPDIIFTPSHLAFLNHSLAKLDPVDILRWAIVTLPGLFQTTAMGLTGLVTVDMLSKLNPSEPHPLPLIFIDTLYHFEETLDLAKRVQEKYPTATLHIYKPDGCNTVADFESAHGKKLWERDDDLYDYLVKVEPARRAYQELGVRAVLTGRRKAQGGKRAATPIVEIDETGLIKINPLANWTFQQVDAYIKANNVPYNTLLDMGYRSVGDWHSTVPVQAGEDERAGRWKGQEKTECGLHEDYFKKVLAKKKLAELAQMQQTLSDLAIA